MIYREVTQHYDANLLILGMELVASKQSKPWSQDSIGSPEAYLMDSFNSTFLKSLPITKRLNCKVIFPLHKWRNTKNQMLAGSRTVEASGVGQSEDSKAIQMK